MERRKRSGTSRKALLTEALFKRSEDYGKVAARRGVSEKYEKALPGSRSEKLSTLRAILPGARRSPVTFIAEYPQICPRNSET
jgi:hypothetical protein